MASFFLLSSFLSVWPDSKMGGGAGARAKLWGG